MKYMYQNIVNTGLNTFDSIEGVVAFINQIESITDNVAAMKNHMELLRSQGVLISSSHELIDSNTYKTIRIFNTAQDRQNYIDWIAPHLEEIVSVVNTIGWTYTARDLKTEITDERWAEIQQELTV